MTREEQYQHNKTAAEELYRQDHHFDDYNTRACARAREETDADGMLRIREAYEDNVGQLTGAVAQLIETALNHGLTVDEIIMACEETGFAPKPSPRYLRKILMNWAENGVTVSRIRHEVRGNRALKWWRDDWHV